jgi:hypothetical protein
VAVEELEEAEEEGIDKIFPISLKMAIQQISSLTGVQSLFYLNIIQKNYVNTSWFKESTLL